MSPVVAISTAAEGVLTLVIPLGAFLAVLAWYIVLLRRRHPEWRPSNRRG